MNIDLGKFGKNLSTRGLASRIRNEVEKYLTKKELVELDIREVELMSSGFSDELFGKLSIKFSDEEIRAFVKVLYPENKEKESLLRNLIRNGVIQRRKLESKN